jgi:hypothetical protein
MARKGTTRSISAIEQLEGRVLLSSTPRPEVFLHPTFRLAHHAGLAPASTVGATGISPSQMRQAYAANAIGFGGVAGDGSGQTIAIIDAFDDPNAASDLHNFDQGFGLSDAPSFTRLNENGGTALPGVDTTDAKPNTWALEESLDIEWAHVMAPRAGIILYEAQSTSLDDLVAAAVNTARNNPNVTVISMSFGGGEFAGETGYDSYFTTPAGHKGITFLSSTGDSGAPGGYPAYSPNVVAVGGTTLSIDSAGNYVGESGWSGSGGGESTQESEPSFQHSVQSTGVRITPDVSIDADPNSGVPVYDTFDNSASAPWMQVGGTSLAAPMWAGLIAVADQGRAINGLSSLDGPSQTLPMLYKAPASDFHDITTGNNGGFGAGAGYDAVTGRGSPIAHPIVATLAGQSSASAAFVKLDTATRGTWNGAYGADGYDVFQGSASLPSYAQVSAANASGYTWQYPTTDVRGLQTGLGASSRIAGCYYSGTNFTLDVNLAGSTPHPVAMYVLDWENAGRAETVQVSDAGSGAMLDTRSISNFSGGQWLVWNLSGHVKFTITNTGPVNAVVGGLMFGGPSAAISSSASFVKLDTTTQGTWSGAYGAGGYDVFQGGASLPSYAQVSVSNALGFTWQYPTPDARGVQTAPGSASRVAGCYYSATSFTLDVNLTDGKPHSVAMYLLDWENAGRTETVRVADAGTGAVLDTRNLSNFSQGQWLVWNLSGHVKITITNTGPTNAVASGLMFGA